MARYGGSSKRMCKGANLVGQLPINAQTGEVGTGTHFSGNPTNQELARQWSVRSVLLWIPIKEFLIVGPLHVGVFYRQPDSHSHK